MRKPSEQRGQLYLGAAYDSTTGRIGDQPVYLDADDLVTHGVCIGMTGSGKTGLCISLLEECALADIPVLIIDPKGDLTNLALVFPELDKQAFLPWVEEEAARRKNISLDELADAEATKWKQGLADWGIEKERLQALKNSAEVTIFTPGSSAGTPLNVLSSFDPPENAPAMDRELLRDLVAGTVSAILGLLGDSSPDSQDRRHILLSTLLERRWLAGEQTTLADLIQLIQSPPFEMLGALSLDSFFPEKDRRELAFELNALIASPSFQSWLEGEPLEVETMLRTKDGRARLSVCTISHLSDAERMFFVALLLNQFISWMRRQPGTSSLRALLYFDEIFGYLPPHPKNPPTKQQLLTLLKQGRAFGTAAMLVTQNPVDLDYKALANCGVWFLGKLQTQQDKDRILDGLEGAIHQAGGSSDHKSLDMALSALGSRVFLLNNIHAQQPLMLHSRWAMSYLAGPMTRSQIREWNSNRTPEVEASVASASLQDYLEIDNQKEQTGSDKLLNVPTAPPPGLTARFENAEAEAVYRADLYAVANITFRDRSSSEVLQREVMLTISPAALVNGELDWGQADIQEVTTGSKQRPSGSCRYHPVAGVIANTDELKQLGSMLIPHLVENYSIIGYVCKKLELKSKLGESESDFNKRVAAEIKIVKTEQEKKLKVKAEKKIAALQKKIDAETDELARDQARANTRRSEEMMSTVASVGSTLLSLFNSRRRSSAAGKISSAIKKFGTKRGMTQRAELEVIESRQAIAAAQREIDQLIEDLASEIVALNAQYDAIAEQIESYPIRPFKSNIDVDEFGYLWHAID